MALMRGSDVVVSAVPYRFNAALARAAVEAQASFCDLGGNTAVVEEELALDGAAKEAGVAIVPDCGLAPGLGNILASIGVDQVSGARDVRIRCGGLPIDKTGPLGYALLFSIEGLTNEYTGDAEMIRDGELEAREAFTECEPFDGPPELGELEAFLTSGGTSTAPRTFRGRLQTYDYKTIRYRGHFDRVRAMIDLGLLDQAPIWFGSADLVPRDAFHAIVAPRLVVPNVRDLALLQVEVTDAAGKGVRFQMLQHFDEETGFTAMEQTTGYPTTVVARMLAQRELPPGAHPPERCGFGESYLTRLAECGVRVERTAI